MVKLIGMILIASSLLSLFAAAFIELRYGGTATITGNAISNILTQAPIPMNAFDYAEGIAFSYSVASLFIGTVFLLRV